MKLASYSHNCFDWGTSSLIVCLTLGLVFTSEYNWGDLCDLEEVSRAGSYSDIIITSQGELLYQAAVTFECSPQLSEIMGSTCLKIHPVLDYWMLC